MNVDLTYKNKAGISLQNVIDILSDGKNHTKKDIQGGLKTEKSIDALLKKLETSSMIEKSKEGNKLLYTASAKKEAPEKAVKKEAVKKEAPEEAVKKKVIKAKVKGDSPAKTKAINEQTANITKDHQITALVDMEDLQRTKKPKPTTREVSQADLDILKQEMQSRLGKEVTTILHKRNSRAVKKRKDSAQEIFEKQQTEFAQNFGEMTDENPYRFIMNFFKSTLNGEKATPYFRRRDEYVVKSLYNKFKVLCEPIDEYEISPHNLPFYRAITINEKEWVVKIYHIDMNRVIRGVYTLFKLNQFDNHYIDFDKDSEK